jgi:hypothetical protein
MTAPERQLIRRIVDLERRLEQAQRRIAYLERDKQLALRRAREATDQARYWEGVSMRLTPRRRSAA